MENVLIFVVLFAGTLGFVVSLVLFFANRAESFSARLLAAFLSCFSFFAIYFGLQTTSFFQHYPHLWKVFVWVSFLYMPISYIYVRSVLRQSFRFERWDFLFLLPAIIYTASYIPVFLLPASVKLQYLEEIARNPIYITMEPHSLLPPWSGFIIRVLLGIGCVWGQYYQLKQWNRRTMDNIGRDQQNRYMYRWLLSFTLVMATFYALVSIQFLLRVQFGYSFGAVTLLTIVGTILFVSMSLLFKPSILYGMQGWVRPSAAVVQAVPVPAPHGSSLPADVPVPAPHGSSLSADVPVPALADEAPSAPLEEKKKSYLSPEQGAAIKQALESHFTANRPFLQPGYSIAQLAHELKIPSYQLSGFINQEYGKNFNELINEHRVHHLVEHFKDADSLSQFTLEAIGREVGFNSRAAFISAVRKVTGKTPSEVLGRRGKEVGAGA